MYPPETVRALLATELVTDATRDALLERLVPPPAEPQFFTEPEMATLRAVCARLFPQPDRPEVPIDVAAVIDQRLKTGEGDGWRYAALPPDEEAYRQGLAALNARAQQQFQQEFTKISGEQQDAILTAAQQQAAESQEFPMAKWFEELLAEAPKPTTPTRWRRRKSATWAWPTCPGWTHLGLNNLDPASRRRFKYEY